MGVSALAQSISRRDKSRALYRRRKLLILLCGPLYSALVAQTIPQMVEVYCGQHEDVLMLPKNHN